MTANGILFSGKQRSSASASFSISDASMATVLVLHSSVVAVGTAFTS